MQADLQEFRAAGTIGRARQLADATGQQFNADRLPQNFTGDPNGLVVLVHVNPKQSSGSLCPTHQASQAPTHPTITNQTSPYFAEALPPFMVADARRCR
jgi:hypothetical protein